MSEGLFGLWLDAVYWSWCHWTNHKGSRWHKVSFRKVGRVDISFRGCGLCGRVHPDDVDPFLDAIEADLDAQE